jgi:hypothetical protein
MAGAILVASLGISAAILLFLYYKVTDRSDGKHYAMQVILLSFLLGIILLLGKVAIDYEDNCAWNVANSTRVNGVDIYNYTYTCSENTNNTARTFYNITLWITRLVAIYLLMTFAFELIAYFGLVKRGGQS